MDRKLKTTIGIWILAMWGIVSSASAQQAFTYSQYMNNLAPVNNAYTTLIEGGALHSVMRKQWVGIDGAPLSVMVNGHLSIPRLEAAAGMVVSHDRIGVENLTEANGFFAKAIQLDENLRLAASLSVGVRFFKAAYTQLDPYDLKFRNDIQETIPTVGFGLLLCKPETFYVGVSLPRTNVRFDADNQTGRYAHRNTWYLSAGYLAALDDDFSLKATSMAVMSSGMRSLLDVSVICYAREQFGLGVGYRNSNDAVVLLDYRASTQFSIGYSYQASMDRTALGTVKNGSHEITLGYRFGKLYRTLLL